MKLNSLYCMERSRHTILISLIGSMNRLSSKIWTILNVGANFAFKNDIFRLKDALRIPDVIRTTNRLVVDGIDALCIFLKRFAYPCRYSDMIQRFGRPVLILSMVSNQITYIQRFTTCSKIPTRHSFNHVNWRGTAS